MRFYFRRIHFLSSDVDYVRNPAHDLQRGIVSRDMLPALPRRKPRTEPSMGEPIRPALPESPSLVETVSEEEKARPRPDRIGSSQIV